ncbi:hypothetical protein IDH10_00370 [Pelagibacterales bacterium SAG-MED20]|nr:hypothetical protein [Pelagibacterales bacterium SAG-MED20]
MIIIGINDNHDASACLIKDGVIVDLIQEERLRRKKNLGSFPRESLQYILKKNNINPKDIDQVCVANIKLAHMNFWNVASDFKTSDWYKLQEKFHYEKIFHKKKVKIKDVFPNYKPKIKLSYSLKGIPFISSDDATKKNHEDIVERRIKTICNFLKVDKKKITFYDHHNCHAFYGFYSSPNSHRGKLTAVVTADGGGDGLYNSVSYFKKGKFKSISRSRNNWIAKIYESVTLILGMNPFRHCYKVMGLAPYSDTKKYGHISKFFQSCMKVKGVDFLLSKKMTDQFFFFKENLRQYRFDNIAGGLQDFVEKILSKWFYNISKKFNTNFFVFSGGVAHNVKANKFLSEQKFIKKLWIPPGPGDESLSVGAIYCYLYDKLGYRKCLKYIKPIQNAYLGMSITKEDLSNFTTNSLVKKNFKNINDKNFKNSAKLLKNGEILFVCMGRQEFGPRSLGHRSIICDPSNVGLVKKINSTIKMRDFWMPFTPSILDTYEKKYLKKNSKLNINYMTSCVDPTELGKKFLKAAMHPSDFTVRPQIVRHKDSNLYYKLIREFSKISGVGAVLNTSLNMHEFPVVAKPLDIVNELIKKNSDINFNILIDNQLFVKKNYRSR